MWTISTAGIGEDSALGILKARALKGKGKVDGNFTRAIAPNLGMLEWALSLEADLDDMALVKTVNPASWLNEAVLAEQREAVHDIAFRRYHCNQWVAAKAPWINPEVWDACKEEPTLLLTRPTVLGVDASIRHDSTVVATVQKDEEGVYHATFEVWEPVRGQEVQMEMVMEHIREQARTYNVTAVCFDPYFMHHAAQTLDSEGIPMWEWKQDNARMVPATRTLHEAVSQGKLRHGGDPVARSHALNAEVVETERGIRIKKTAGRGKIDAIVALAMAVEWASRNDPPPPPSVYESRGILGI
jgi:phage terminase large subunit-like protein